MLFLSVFVAAIEALIASVRKVHLSPNSRIPAVASWMEIIFLVFTKDEVLQHEVG